MVAMPLVVARAARQYLEGALPPFIITYACISYVHVCPCAILDFLGEKRRLKEGERGNTSIALYYERFLCQYQNGKGVYSVIWTQL